MIRDLKTMIQNWVNPWIRDGQILRSSRSRSSRSSRSGHDQIQIIRSRPRIPRIDTPNGSILDPLFDTPGRPCQDMSGIVTNGPIVVGIRAYGPLAIHPSFHITTWCGTLFGPLKSGPKRGTKPDPHGWISTPLGGFRPPGEK